MKRSEYFPYLQTLRRVPDDVILSVATRDLNVGDPNSCICGWVIREAVARLLDIDPENITSQSNEVRRSSNGGDGVYDSCAELFGGGYEEWGDVFYGVVGSCAPFVERAFVERVMEAVV